MTIRKCDRCHKEIETNNSNFLDGIAEAVNDAVSLLTGKRLIKLVDKHSGKELDLCPDCNSSLQSWLLYGQKVAKIVETIPPDEIRRNGILYVKADEVKQNDNETHEV